MKFTGKHLTLYGLLWIFTLHVSAQKCTLFGTIKDAESKEAVMGGKIFILKNYQGDLADFQGEYEVTGLKKGTYDVICESEGYYSDTLFGIKLRSKFTEHSFQLTPIPCLPRADKALFIDFHLYFPDSLNLKTAQSGVELKIKFGGRFGDAFNIFRTWGLQENEIVLSMHRSETLNCEPIPPPEDRYPTFEWTDKITFTQPGVYQLRFVSEEQGERNYIHQVVVK